MKNVYSSRLPTCPTPLRAARLQLPLFSGRRRVRPRARSTFLARRHRVTAPGLGDVAEGTAGTLGALGCSDGGGGGGRDGEG